jgi:hypothetical protein
MMQVTYFNSVQVDEKVAAGSIIAITEQDGSIAVVKVSKVVEQYICEEGGYYVSGRGVVIDRA